ncbi:RAD55 family ATPase [Pyrofollis japonicus]|uniref:RAD55 family ATPase n=1 Tax=Pyrofollis japonicus TaxID=3060460 RepID=UPI00295BB25F|nr:ATPase domain-containing protein [Pyrofollis japonicus]
MSLSERAEEFLDHMKRVGIDLASYREKGLLKYYWLPLAKDARVLADKVVEIVVTEKPQRLVIDTLTPLLKALRAGASREFLHNLVNLVTKPSRITVYALLEVPHGSRTIGYGLEEFIADAIMLLRLDEYRGIVRRTLSIRKARWCPQTRMSYGFEITSRGIVVYREYIGGVKGRFDLSQKHSTGVPELDKMLRGGIPRGAIVVISGPSGVGKSTLALTIIKAELERGGKPLYVTFEESVEQVRYIARTLGIEGEFDIISLSPLGITPSGLYSIAIDRMDTYKPTLVVIDGIGIVLKWYGEETGLNLVRTLAYEAKLRGITTILTSLEDLLSGAGSPSLSTIADVLIGLGFERDNDVIRRVIAVLKARGIVHDTRVREIVFEQDRISIDKYERGASGINKP